MKGKEALYAVIGGIVGTIVTLMLGLVVPLGAQSGNDGHFDTVTCKRLKVISRSNGKPMVMLATDYNGGYVGVWEKLSTESEAMIKIEEYSGIVASSNYNSTRPLAAIGVDQRGNGAVHIRDRYGRLLSELK